MLKKESSQSPPYQIEWLNEKDGLGNNTANAVWKDSQELLWVGTGDGLYCYDGYHFVRYGKEESSPIALTSNYIHTITEDEKGNLWIGTDNGLNILNPVSKTLRTFLDRQNLLLIIKEAVSNIVKHTEPGRVEIKAFKDENQAFNLFIINYFDHKKMRIIPPAEV